MMMGRKVSDQTNIRTNVMVTCLAPSGSGKDAPKSAANILVERACLPSCRIGSEVASAEGVYDWMELAGQSLFIVDEIDLFLAKMANEEKGGLTKAFLEFHNHARGTAKSRARAGMTEVKSLNQPHLCLLGFSIPRFFFEQLNDRMLAGGLAARLMVFETPGRGKKNKHMQHDPDQSLIDEVRWWEDYVPNVNFVGNGVSVADRFYRPIRVDMDYDAVQVFNDLFDYENQKMAEGQAINSDARTSVWCRLCEKAKTLALIHACSRDRDGAIVNKESAQWAADLATCMSANILAMLDLHGYEGEFDLKRKKFVKAMVRWHTENGADAWMPSWQLSRTLRSWSKKELSDMRETLLEQQCIECATQISSGRPGLAFRLKRMDGTGIL
jgi:hypothetical protein